MVLRMCLELRMWNNGNSHPLVVGMQNSTATLEDSLEFSYKTKHTLIIWSRNHSPKLKMHLHTKSYTDVCRGFIHNQPNLEAANMSFRRWVDVPWYIWRRNTIQCQRLNKELTNHEQTWRKLTMWKKPTWKGCIVSALTTWHSGKRQNYGDSKMSGFQH
jgi:hypothetical protein